MKAQKYTATPCFDIRRRKMAPFSTIPYDTREKAVSAAFELAPTAWEAMSEKLYGFDTRWARKAS